jgi:hypothetical protein
MVRAPQGLDRTGCRQAPSQAFLARDRAVECVLGGERERGGGCGVRGGGARSGDSSDRDSRLRQSRVGLGSGGSQALSRRLRLRPAGLPRWRLVSAGVVIATGVAVVFTMMLGSGTASSTLNSAAAPGQGCPSASLVATTLNQTVKKAAASVFSFGAGPTRGSRLTCSYTTIHGTTVDYELSSNVNPFAIAAAEQAGFGTSTTFSGGAGFEHAKAKSVVIPAFAPGLVAWTLKRGGLLDALYGKTNLLIIAPNATVTELEALAKETQGIPQPDLRVDKST